MTILVTGGAGFIGSHICQGLLERGERVVSIDNFNNYYNPQYKRENIAEVAVGHEKHFSSLAGDLLDRTFLDQVFTSYAPESVIHLAALAGVRPSIKDPIAYSEVNINGTLNLLETMRQHKVPRLIFASSSSVYGNNQVPFSEQDPADQPISPYAATKKAGELLCYTYHHLYQLSIACLRFFTVYGPRQRPDLAIYKFMKLISEHERIPFYGDGSTQRDYTFIDDLKNGVLSAVDWIRREPPSYEIFNLGGSSTISLSQLVATIEETLGIEAQLQRLPAQSGDVERTYADISKAQRLLGYNRQTPFSEGIKSFVAWFRERGR